MKCFICDTDVSEAEFSKVVPLYHGKDTVYACTKHQGVKEEFDEQNNPGQ